MDAKEKTTKPKKTLGIHNHVSAAFAYVRMKVFEFLASTNVSTVFAAFAAWARECFHVCVSSSSFLSLGKG